MDLRGSLPWTIVTLLALREESQSRFVGKVLGIPIAIMRDGPHW